MLSCKCQVNQTVLDFINYCTLHSRVDADILREICNEWKNKIKGYTHIIFTSKNMGIASTVEIKFSRCSKVCQSNTQTSKYAISNMQGTVSQRKNSSWYDLNLKLTLGTLASGLCSFNMSELFSFLSIPKAKSFHKRLFPVCEFRIGASLRKFESEIMKEGRILEVKKQLELEEKEYKYW